MRFIAHHPDPCCAAQVVTVTDPANAAIDAAVGTNVTATLDNTAGNVTAQTFVIRSSQTALGTSFTPSTSGSDAIINPTEDFRPGERVMATVTAGVTSNSLGVTPHVWTFRTHVTSGTGVFVESSQTLGNRKSRGVAVGDLDGDGHLDAFVANSDSQANRVWFNDGSGTFAESGQTLGTGLVGVCPWAMWTGTAT